MCFAAVTEPIIWDCPNTQPCSRDQVSKFDVKTEQRKNVNFSLVPLEQLFSLPSSFFASERCSGCVVVWKFSRKAFGTFGFNGPISDGCAT